ncbi:MAG: acyl-CoA dehydrogenase, partial [Legionella sp.]
KKLIEHMRKGDVGAFALTEEMHGSDLVANELFAQPNSQGWQLSGSKWCVNFATYSQILTLLCRSHEKGGPLGCSLFFLDKQLLANSFTPTAKLPTLGVRGLDISGFILDQAQIPADALIGKENHGLELTAKSFQISRTLLASIAIGGADTALRLALSFSLQRQLYGKAAFAIPVVQQRLGEQFTQLLIADCTALSMIRACTFMPEQMSLWSAIIKSLIPKMTEEVVEQSALILGARAYLRTTEWAVFQKIRRDIQVIGLFDGSTQVNLSFIAGNLLPQARGRGRKTAECSAQCAEIFNLQTPCAPFVNGQYVLFTHEEDLVFAGLAQLNSPLIDSLIQKVREEISFLDQQVLYLHEEKRFDPRSLVAFDLAERYCWIFAAACCLQFWHYNQGQLSDELNQLDWLHLAIEFILKKLNDSRLIDNDLATTMAKHLCTYRNQNRLFSVVPIKLAE